VVTPTSSKTALARGWARQQELAVESEVERQAEQAALLADLGREPGHTERLLIEQAAHLAVRSRRFACTGPRSRSGRCDEASHQGARKVGREARRSEGRKFRAVSRTNRRSAEQRDTGTR